MSSIFYFTGFTSELIDGTDDGVHDLFDINLSSNVLFIPTGIAPVVDDAGLTPPTLSVGIVGPNYIDLAPAQIAGNVLGKFGLLSLATQLPQMEGNNAVKCKISVPATGSMEFRILLWGFYIFP